MSGDDGREALRLFRARHPLEIRHDDHWSPLGDETIVRQVFSLPESRAIDVATGICLRDGRIVRFAITRDARFDEVKLVRDTFGGSQCATGYCRRCRAYRMLDVAAYSGGRALTCVGCRSWEVEDDIVAVPI